MPELTDDQRRAVIARVTRRLIPFTFICYVVAYVDRVNIGFAASELQRDLGLTDATYGIGAGLFFLGYCLFEIPSNLILARVGARLWISRIMIVWGFVSMATLFVHDTGTFYLARVLLGVAEAGFFPGIVLYLTYWIPAAERAKTSALFMIAIPIAIITGAPLSQALLGWHGRLGLAGWQWLFLVEGLPAVVLGLLALRVLTDRPEHASWLEPKAREWLVRTMAREQGERTPGGHSSALAGLSSKRAWLLASIFFLNSVVTYGVFLWLPKILRDAAGADDFRLTVMTSVPFAAALVGMVVIGRHSDQTGERKWHVACCALAAAAGLIVAASAGTNLVLLVLGFTLSQVGQRSILSVFWAIPPMFLRGSAAAAGIAMINAVGSLGGSVGPSVMGWLKQSTGGYGGGLLVLTAALVIEAALVMSLRVPSADRAPMRTSVGATT
jgi:ACS family tartrate transporter-like MFS transporter